MIGESVEHPQYGRGRVVAQYRNGTEWMVRFDSGLRFRRPRREFNGQRPRETLGVAGDATQFVPMPMALERLQARHLIESLRAGVAPAQRILDLTIGLETERKSLSRALNQAHSEGGAVRAVLGEYGFGKSHVIEVTTHEALDRKFLVAATSLDLQELPPHKAFDIYGSLMRNLRYPESDERGLAPLLSEILKSPALQEQLTEIAPKADDPLVCGLQALSETSSTDKRTAWENWLMGGRKERWMDWAMKRSRPHGFRFPSIYRNGHNARQIAYLLTGISVLARLVGYSGLCVLLDEAESYSLLYPYQRPKAGHFFAAIVRAALGDAAVRISPDGLPQHRFREYPIRYGWRQSLFFLFTVTYSNMPLEDWLADEQILRLDPRHTSQEINQFLERTLTLHAQAYAYEPDVRQRQVLQSAAELLARGMRSNRLNIRAAMRLSVELFDLLYLHPGYPAATLLDELRGEGRRQIVSDHAPEVEPVFTDPISQSSNDLSIDY